MSVSEVVLIIMVGLTLVFEVSILLSVARFIKGNHQHKDMDQLIHRIDRFENHIREEFRANRSENQHQASLERKEMAASFGALQKTLSDAVLTSMRDFKEGLEKNIRSLGELQQLEFKRMDEKQEKLIVNTEKHLDAMRNTVEEKLQKTLHDRIGQSFESVGKQLEAVQKGLGEMTTLAQDVGGLKRVLSNVKQRGGIGEVQLAMLLEQMLAPGQFEANVRTRSDSSDQVEFAIKLPGREEQGKHVFLPIDAKFPKDIYESLIDAYDSADNTLIERTSRVLEQTIRKMAKDIGDKYLDPPNTTDFAIMFLPFESIYAEVIRRSALIDQLQREFKVIVTGPTTLMAILNSLQMGFRTLHLQKRSSEVWTILGAVKTEFGKFGGLLEKAHRNITTAGGAIDELMGKRTNAINRKLREVESLPAGESEKYLPDLE